MHAVQAYKIAQHLPKSTDQLSIDEGFVLAMVKKIIYKEIRISAKRLNHPAEFKMGDKKWKKKE